MSESTPMDLTAALAELEALLAEETARLDWLSLRLGVEHGPCDRPNARDVWKVQPWETRALNLWLRDGQAQALRAAIDSARQKGGAQ